MLDDLRAQVLEANLELVRRGLVLYTFGNVSGIDRQTGLVAIKPSGVAYESMQAEHMVITDLDGTIVEGSLRPSSDLATHLLLYREFPTIGAVVHTHSEYATAWAEPAAAFPLTAPRTPITFTALCLSPKNCLLTTLMATTCTTPASPSSAAFATSTLTPCLLCSLPAMPPSAGARHRRTQHTMQSCLRQSPAWAFTPQL